jgi:hypothetical protein
MEKAPTIRDHMGIRGSVYPMRLLVNNTIRLAKTRDEWAATPIERRLGMLESLLLMKPADAQIVGRRIRHFTYTYGGEYTEEGQTDFHVKFSKQFSDQFTIQERRKAIEIALTLDNPDFSKRALNYLRKKRAEIQAFLDSAKARAQERAPKPKTDF